MSHPIITGVETVILDLPTVRTHVLSMASIDVQTVTLVSIRCDDGNVGYGEGTTIGGLSYGEESPEGIKLAIDTYFAPALIGQRADRVGALVNRLSGAIVGNRFAKNAVECALLDAQGKRLGIAVSELLGGRVRDSLPVLWTLASGNAHIDIEEAQRMFEMQRHKDFKIKIGKRELLEDLAHIKAIKSELGDDISLRVDVNQRWSESTARKGIAMLADLGVDLVEQPTSHRNKRALARLRTRAAIPIMADESIQGKHDIFELCAMGCADIYSIKIAQCGGMTAARAAADIVIAAGADLYGGTMLEAGIGSAASAQLFATWPTIAQGTELFGPLLLRQDILAQPLVYENFELRVPSGPGLGIELDDDRIAFFRRDRTTATIAAQPQKEIG